jgi:hypothetical protein
VNIKPMAISTTKGRFMMHLTPDEKIQYLQRQGRWQGGG